MTTQERDMLNPSQLIKDSFSTKLNIDVNVEKREYPEETIYIVSVPYEVMDRAIQLGNEIDVILEKANVNGFVTVRAEPDVEQIGEAAENKARDWLGLSRITAHRPERDKRGWDFILEYDLNSEKPLEQAEPVVTCKLQVKGTVDDEGWINIKLSNWNKMVKQPFPFFVLVIVFSKTDLEVVNAAYLIHIDEGYVSQVLKRLRGLSRDERNKLHEKKLRVNWNEENKLDPRQYGTSIGRKIRDYVGPSAESYVVQKLKWIKSSGYGDRPIQGHIVFHNPDDDLSKLYGQLADLAIGTIKEIPIESMAMDEVRFGIPKPIKMLPKLPDGTELEQVSISIDQLPSICDTQVTLSDLRHETMVSVMCKTFRASAIFPFLHKDHEKFKLVSPFITFIMEPPATPQSQRARIGVSVKISDSENMSLENFLKSTKAVKLLRNERQNGLLLTFEFDENSHLTTPIGAYNFDFPPNTDALLSLSEHVGFLYRHFELDSRAEVTLAWLSNQAKQLETLYLMLKPMAMKSESLEVKFTNKNRSSGAGKKTACIISGMATVGRYLLCAVGMVTGKSEVIQDEATKDCEVLRISEPSYEVIKQYQKLMHDGENYSIEPLLNECTEELLKREFDIVLSLATGRLLMRVEEMQMQPNSEV